MAVTPGQQFTIQVGAIGSNTTAGFGNGAGGLSGGVPSGGSSQGTQSGGGGGGATVIRLGGATAAPVVVAGGGGGVGTSANGGNAGPTGSPGSDVSAPAATGGGGGSNNAPGAGGTGSGYAQPVAGQPGAQLVGGNAAPGAGGGGGGRLAGGGGASNKTLRFYDPSGAGGGGGANYLDGTVTAPVNGVANAASNGSASVTTAPCPVAAFTATQQPDRGQVEASGNTIVYSVLLTNTGDVDLTGINVNSTGFTGSGTTPVFTCPSSTLAQGETETCTATYVVVPGDLSLTSFTSSLTGTATGGSVTVNTPESTSSVTVYHPALAIGGGETFTTNDRTGAIAGTSDAPSGTVVTVTVAGQVLTTTVTSAGTWTVTPATIADGSYSVTASVSIPGGNTTTVTQNRTVTLPAAPVAGAKSTTGTKGQTQRLAVTVPSGGSLSLWNGTAPVTSLRVPGQGTYRVDGSELVFVPLTDFTGSAAPVAYQVTDRFGQIGRSTYQATVKASSVDVPGSASPTTVRVRKGVAVTLSPLANVVAPSGENVRVDTLRIGRSPSTATAVSLRTAAGGWRVNAQGRVRFTPDATFVGVSTVYFRVRASDGSVLRSSLSLVVTGTVSGKLRATVYFGKRSAHLDSHDRQVLRRVAARVPDRATTSALAVGYVQPERYRANDARLSRARGRNVATAVQRMVDLQRIVIAGRGRAEQNDWRARRATVELRWRVTQR